MSGHEKGRALALAAIMVLSVVATGLAFTGSVAADDQTVSGGDGLQQAIDNAESGDTVTVTDSAEYGSIDIDKNVTVRAADGENPTITSTDDKVVDITASGATLDGFTVDATPDSDVTAGNPDDDSNIEGRNTVSVADGSAALTDVTISNNELVDGTAYAQAQPSVTFEGNDFSVDGSTTGLFASYSESAERTLNGEDNPNDQIIALVQDNNNLENVQIGQDLGVNYGIELSRDDVTTGNGDNDGQLSIDATVYGADGDGALSYKLNNPSDNTVQSDIINNNDDDNTYEFSVDDDFMQEGNYTVNVDDTDSETGNDGSTDIHSEYEVVNLNPDSLNDGDDDQKITGQLVDRGGDAVTGETVALQTGENDNDDEDSDETNDTGYFVLNGDENDNLDFSDGDTVLITGDDKDDANDGDNANDDVVYETYEVGAQPQEETWTLNTNRSSVPYEIPQNVDLVVRDQNGNRVTGTELANLADDNENNGDLTATQMDEDVLNNAEVIDNDGDSVDDEQNALRLTIEAGQRNTDVVINASDNDDFGTTSLTVGEEEQPATVNFDDQTSDDGKTVTVDSVDLPNDGYVAIHNATQLNNGKVQKSVIGVSEYLSAGQHDDVQVTLFDVPGKNYPDDKTLDDGDQTLVAMPHKETNGNQQYNFITSDGSEDGAYTNDGHAVVDSGVVTYNAGQATGNLVSDNDKNFGSVTVGQSATKTVTLRNAGDASVTVTATGIDVTEGKATEFSIVNNPAGSASDDKQFTLAPGETKDLTVKFSPKSGGDKAATLVAGTENDGSATTSLSGTGKTVQVVGNLVSDQNEPFGEVDVGDTATRKTYLRNAGDGPVTVTATGIDVTEGKASEFSIVNNPAGSASDDKQFTLAPGETTALTVKFSPKSGGDKAGTLVAKTANDGSASTKLSGTGIAGPQKHTLTVDGNDGRTFYSFRASGDVEITGTPNSEDRVRQNTASGAVGQGQDTYTFVGDLQNLYVHDGIEGATVRVDGKQVDSDSYNSVVSFKSDGQTTTSYRFGIENGKITGTQDLTSEDSHTDDNANGAVRAGKDTYTFTGTFSGLDIDGPGPVVLNGQAVDPSLFYNKVLFRGNGKYSFSVSGEVKSGARLTSEDSFSGNSGMGSVGGGVDGYYTYSGLLTDLTTDPGVTAIDGDGDEVDA